ncbi:MAG: glutamate synthase subunit alpha, partial [Candidatus Omnitrophota bacterium]
MKRANFPKKQGLYDPAFEHDSCGVGFICDIKGEKTNALVKDAVNALCRLSHRGAVGADPKTGDGAGILIQMPHDFFCKVSSQASLDLPDYGSYGTGLIFLPLKKEEHAFCKNVIEKVVRDEKQIVLGWRTVPVDDSTIGEVAKRTKPVIEQIFIKKGDALSEQLQFERKLYVIRRRVENIIAKS